MARVSMDIKEMPKSILGYTCILVCVCEYTNWVKAIPLVDQKSGTIADAIFSESSVNMAHLKQSSVMKDLHLPQI